jgi:lactoylglutathione lyase
MSSELTYRFDHVHIFCSSLAASEEWFVQKMGAELVRRRDPKPALAVDLRMGGVVLLLREQTPGESLSEGGPSRFGTDHMGLEVDDLEATATELKRRGVEFEMEPKLVRPGLSVAFVKGPDELRIELLQRVQ